MPLNIAFKFNAGSEISGLSHNDQNSAWLISNS